MPAKTRQKPKEKLGKNPAKGAPPPPNSPAKRRASRLPVRLPEDLREKVRRTADAQNLTEAALIRRACDAYVQKAEAGKDLDEVEERLTAGLSRVHRLAALSYELQSQARLDVQVSVAMLDQLVRFVLTATPDSIAPDADKARGKARYKKFMEALAGAIVTDDKRGRFADRLTRQFNLAAGIENSDDVRNADNITEREGAS